MNRMNYRFARRRLPSALMLIAAGCTVGPKYQTPALPTGADFKEAVKSDFATAGIWRPAAPNDAAPRGEWWRIFGDEELNQLENRLTVSNQNLKLAQARFREARAIVAQSRAAEFPSISGGGVLSSIQDSSNQPYFETQNPTPQGDLSTPLDLSYEVDLWGKIAHTVSASREEAQASEADVQTISLSLHAELAIDDVELRSADAQQSLLDSTVKAYEDALRLTQNRLEGGFAPASDVAQAQTQLDTTRVQDTDIGVMRAHYEHAIAVLLGQPPNSFGLAQEPLTLSAPVAPPGLPSELLQRRPDIAAAERRVAEANDRIGIAKAAFYPSLNFSAQSGFMGSGFAKWFGWPSLFWAVGTSMTQELFDGGLLHARMDGAEAGYDAAVASYRQTALMAFREVEDNLAALHILSGEAQQQREAVSSAENSLRIFTNRYVGGADTYLQVINAQTFALQNQRNDVDIQRRRVEASILLIKALGGGWNSASLPALKDHGMPKGAFVPLAW